MADDPKHYEDDEYHFSEIEGNQNPENMEPTLEYSGAAALRRNIIVIIGLLIVVLAVYKLLGSFFTSHTQKTAEIPSAMQSKGNIMMSSQPARFTPAVEQSQQSVAANAAMQEKLSQLEIASESTKTDVNTLTTSVTELKTGLSDLTTKISELNTTIENLTTQVQQQQEQLAIMKQHHQVHRIIKRSHWTGYFIQAMIAGRAWLRSVSGSTLTVSVGSRIDGLGVVKVIDPRRGEVIMSSGRKITFSANDR